MKPNYMEMDSPNHFSRCKGTKKRAQCKRKKYFFFSAPPISLKKKPKMSLSRHLGLFLMVTFLPDRSEHHLASIYNIEALSRSAIDAAALQVEQEVLRDRQLFNGLDASGNHLRC